MLSELPRHSDSIILHTENDRYVSISSAWLLRNTNVNHTADRCEFYSITANIEKDLCQTQLVGNDIFMNYILCINIKILLFGMYRSLNDRS